MRLDPQCVERYLTTRLGGDVRLLGLERLGDDAVPAPGGKKAAHRPLKTFGYGKPVLVRYEREGREARAVLGTVSPNSFGHEYRADRAANQILSFDTYSELPRHVRATDVGILLPEGELLSLAEGKEFFLLTEYVEGEPYARDLQRLRDDGDLGENDLRRAEALARYLVEIHGVKRDEPPLYRRRIRDLLGSGEGIMGLCDSYPTGYPLAPEAWLEQIEHACLRWRWKVKGRAHRLSQVHGDFHPFNILFEEGTLFHLLDRSRGAWGEPADDVSGLAINYFFFSLQRSGRLAPPFTTLWERFWETYLEGSGDHEVLEVIAPFFAWRALVVASPLWYDVSGPVRRALFTFAENILAEPIFDPARVNDYAEC